MEDAEHAIVAMGTLASESRVAAEVLREQGLKTGVVRVRSFRPFPAEELRALLEGMKTVVVIDRDISFGYEGALFSEVKAALYGRTETPVYNLITGLGGRDVPYTVIAAETEAAVRGKLSSEVSWPTLRLNEHHRASKQGMAR